MNLQHEIAAFRVTYGPLPYPRGPGSPFDAAGRTKALEIVSYAHDNGKSPRETCNELGLNPSTICLWRRKLEAEERVDEVSIADQVQQDLMMDFQKKIDEFIEKYGPPSSKGMVRMQDITKLPDVSKIEPVVGEVRVEIPGGIVVTGVPKDVWQFIKARTPDAK